MDNGKLKIKSVKIKKACSGLSNSSFGNYGAWD
jgi:hypothetical protein